jgi:hypothetical protein
LSQAILKVRTDVKDPFVKVAWSFPLSQPY